MAVVKTVHLGSIKHEDKTISTFAASSKPALIKEINSWFFDYFYARKEKVLELPPLDDWDHSSEDETYWSVSFPDET